MSDIIERLRKPVAYGPVGAQKDRDEAADEIERLTAIETAAREYLQANDHNEYDRANALHALLYPATDTP